MLSTLAVLICLTTVPVASDDAAGPHSDGVAPPTEVQRADADEAAPEEPSAPPTVEDEGATAAAPVDASDAAESGDAASDDAEPSGGDSSAADDEGEGALDDDEESVEDKGTVRAVATQIAFAWLVTSAACAILPVVNVIPLLGQIVSVLAYPCGGLGALSGAVVTLTGELKSERRGAFLWPVVCGATSQGVLTTGGLVLGPLLLVALAGGSVAGASQLPPEVADGLRAAAALVGIYGAYALSFALLTAAIVGGVVLAPAVAALAWWLTADGRGTGDDGSFRWPGWTEPNHPNVLTVERALPERPAVVTRTSRDPAMAF